MVQLNVRVTNPNDHGVIDSLASQLKDAVKNSRVQKSYEQGEVTGTTKVKKILDKVFYGLISVTMFLCFFSLSASMSANLYE